MLTKSSKTSRVQPLDKIVQMEAIFPLAGSGEMMRDHSYPLFGAVTNHVREMHSRKDGIGIFPISGLRTGATTMTLWDKSRLRFRLSPNHMQELVKLGGKRLDVGNARLVVGAPQPYILSPSPTLQAKVTLAGIYEPDAFLETCRERLAEIGVKGVVEFRDPSVEDGKHQSRRVVRVAGASVVCYWIVVGGLTDADSLRLQYTGLGGKRHFGCGIFTPYNR